MILNVILGFNIDTDKWVKNLLDKNSDNIVVLDYDYEGVPVLNKGILYMSSFDLKEYSTRFNTINYHKSLYGYPKMNGKMSSLFKN